MLPHLRFILLVFSILTLFTSYELKAIVPDADSVAVSQTHAKSTDTTVVPVYNDNFVPKWYDMFTNLPGDVMKYLKVTFQDDKIPFYAAVTALTALAIATDDKTYTESKKWFDKDHFVHQASDIFTSIGDGRTQFGLAIGFAAYGFIGNDARALRTGSQIVQAVLASGAVVQVLKHVTGRQSPQARTKPTGRWDFFPNQVEYHKHVAAYDAFPSGHLTTTLATVEVIAENYPETWWIRPAGYTIGGLLAVSMVNRGIHWYSDYPLAVLLGITFGKIAAHPEGIPVSLLGSRRKMNVNFSPMVLQNGDYGIGIVCSF